MSIIFQMKNVGLLNCLILLHGLFVALSVGVAALYVLMYCLMLHTGTKKKKQFL